MSERDETLALIGRLRKLGFIRYAVSEPVPEGKYILVPETEWTYEFLLFGNDLDATTFATAIGLPLLHLRDDKPKDAPPMRPTEVFLDTETEQFFEQEHAKPWRRTLFGYGVGYPLRPDKPE